MPSHENRRTGTVPVDETSRSEPNLSDMQGEEELQQGKRPQ